MSTRLYDLGRQKFLEGSIAWLADTIKLMGMNLDGSVTDVAVKAITNVTNATPPVVTSAGHGFSNGHIVVQRGVGGNLMANNTFSINNVTANTYELQTVPSSTQAAQNATGSGAYTAGGVAVNLSLAGNLSDIDGVRVGTDTAALAGKTSTFGVANSGNATFVAFPNGSTLYAFTIYKDTGVAATSPVIHFGDGLHMVRVCEVYTALDGTVACDPLEAGIATGTTLRFTNGTSLVTSAVANQGDTTITVTAAPTGPRVGDTVDALANVSPNLPINGNGGDVVVVPDSSVNKIFRL